MAAALWLCALAASVAVAAAAPPVGFTIQGRVYCDTCRAGFVTSASEYIAGAKVRLQCKHFDSEEVKHQVEGVTDESGTYRLLLEDDHQEEICEVLLLESPRKDCAEIEGRRDSARVSLTRNNGMASEVRYANPIGFLRDADD
ncbi:pollen-specific protein C13-like [Ananas comosus]|uniref:Pollen-specific protein C13-like n=1 Tax=Ananas comosus TaxID=4615 RepID=A0A6P5HHP0_ANACO|nr:pollen-specific protein C13-like [Ananas comosus]